MMMMMMTLTHSQCDADNITFCDFLLLPICREAPLCRFTWNFLHEGSSSRRNQQCQILSQSDQRFWFCGGSNFWLSHMKKKSPLTHGLNYRSAYMLHTRCTNVVQVVEALMVSCTCQTAAVCNITQLSVKITSLPSDMDNVHSWYFIRRTFMFFYSVLVRNIALRSHP